jgi:hypothetical protein
MGNLEKIKCKGKRKDDEQWVHGFFYFESENIEGKHVYVPYIQWYDQEAYTWFCTEVLIETVELCNGESSESFPKEIKCGDCKHWQADEFGQVYCKLRLMHHQRYIRSYNSKACKCFMKREAKKDTE